MQVKLYAWMERGSPGEPNNEMALYATEQGIQLRRYYPDHPTFHSDLYSISYTEVVELSYDFEKGRPKGRYGVGGSGLEFQPRLTEEPGADTG